MLILSVLVSLLAAPVPTAEGPLTASSRVEATIRLWHQAGLFDGAALVAKDGAVVWAGGFDPADRIWAVPNDADLRFPIASLTKQFTAARSYGLGSASPHGTGRVTEIHPGTSPGGRSTDRVFWAARARRSPVE